jgi:hypothetical protein
MRFLFLKSMSFGDFSVARRKTVVGVTTSYGQDDRGVGDRVPVG